MRVRLTGISTPVGGVSWEYIWAVIRDQMQMNSSGSSLFLFCGRRTNRIKGLIWEGNRFLLLHKRPEDGTFS